MIDFVSSKWSKLNTKERIGVCQFLDGAVAKVCEVGLLPSSQKQLPQFGTRVEVLMVGSKPGPKSKYGVGAVVGLGWDCVFRTWRVGVRFDEVTGNFMGNPIWGVQAFPNQVHITGSDERPFSTMTPNELVVLAEERRQELWRQPEGVALLKRHPEHFLFLDLDTQRDEFASPIKLEVAKTETSGRDAGVV